MIKRYAAIALAIAAFGGAVSAQEKPVSQAPPAGPKSNYEKLLEIPGPVVIAKKFPVGDPKFGLTATVSYRVDTPAQRYYSLDSGVSIDIENLPGLIKDLETFVTQMKAAEGKAGENVFYRYSDKFWVNYFSFMDDKNRPQQNLHFNPGRFESQGEGTEKMLTSYIDALKAGLTKLRDLQTQR